MQMRTWTIQTMKGRQRNTEAVTSQWWHSVERISVSKLRVWWPRWRHWWKPNRRRDTAWSKLRSIGKRGNSKYRNQRHINFHTHLSIVFYCRHVTKIFWELAVKIAHMESCGLGRWLNTNLNVQFVIVIWHIQIHVHICSSGMQVLQWI